VEKFSFTIQLFTHKINEKDDFQRHLVPECVHMVTKVGQATKVGQVTKVGQATKVGQVTKVRQVTKVGESLEHATNYLAMCESGLSNA